jgi:hypothetical protein
VLNQILEAQVTEVLGARGTLSAPGTRARHRCPGRPGWQSWARAYGCSSSLSTFGWRGSRLGYFM